MRFKNHTKFHICGLNQERILNELSKNFPLHEIDRLDKQNTTFECSFFDAKRVEKSLNGKNIKIESITHFGWFYKLKKLLVSYGLIFAIVLSGALYGVQSQYILQYQISGTTRLEKQTILEFVKKNYTKNKNSLKTKDVEIGLIDNFTEISFVSCMIKGQTLVINIKEKLLPGEKYGEFKPLVASADGCITKIELVSGTVIVKVGDMVQKGDILVEPYTIDTSGNLKKVEAKAQIYAKIYNEGSAQHFEKFVEIKRTGRTMQQNEITLFGLSIYSFKEDKNFKMFESESKDVDLVQNLFLPFKMKKTTYFELEEHLIETNFDDVKEDYVDKARAKALEKCKNCDTIIEEFYTLRHISGETIVNYCIITSEQIGEIKT